jgi:hypothetical protein
MIVEAQIQQHEARKARLARLYAPTTSSVTQRPKAVRKTIPRPAILPEVRTSTWAPRTKWQALARELPRAIRKDRVLTKQVVRELWRSGFAWNEVSGPSRFRPIPTIRFRLIRMVRDACPRMSLRSIGALFGGRHHATIINALQNTAESGQ